MLFYMEKNFCSPASPNISLKTMNVNHGGTGGSQGDHQISMTHQPGSVCTYVSVWTKVVGQLTTMD